MTRELAWPREDLSRVPYPVFMDPTYFEREQECIFRGPLWCYLALEVEIPNPGDYRTTYVGDTQVVVVRAEDNSIHAFLNRCAHRGTQLVRELAGNTKDFTCVYHHCVTTKRAISSGFLSCVALKARAECRRSSNYRTTAFAGYKSEVTVA